MPRAGYGPGRAHLFRFRPAPVSGIPCCVRGLNSQMRLPIPAYPRNCAGQQRRSCDRLRAGLRRDRRRQTRPQGRLQGRAAMTTISSAGRVSGAGAGILDKERTIAMAGFNRWLVPPAALCIHLCIGMAYGFSVFWLPLSRAIGLDGAEGVSGHLAVPGTVHHHLRLESREHGLDVHAVLRRARRLRRDLGRLARARRPAQGRLRRRAVLVRRPRARRDRHLSRISSGSCGSAPA